MTIGLLIILLIFISFIVHTIVEGYTEIAIEKEKNRCKHKWQVKENYDLIDNNRETVIGKGQTLQCEKCGEITYNEYTVGR